MLLHIKCVYEGGVMERKEDTALRVTRRRYEEAHKEERKEKSMVWGTSITRKEAEKINEMLNKYGYTKVQLIRAGYNALMEKANGGIQKSDPDRKDN